MNILYDYQIFCSQEYGGVSRYFYELAKGVRKSGYGVIVGGKFSNNIYLSKLKESVIPFFPKRNFQYKYDLLLYLNFIFREKDLAWGKYDLLHTTYYDPYFLKKLKGKPYVITVYDMIHEIFAKKYRVPEDKTSEYKKITIPNANQIIVISENTKKDLIRLYQIPKNKINVIHLGCSFGALSPKIVGDLPEKYILFVGNRRGYKNFPRFVRSISPLLRKYKNLFLVCAGSIQWDIVEIDVFSKLKVLNKVRHIFFKSDNELAYLYKKALVYVVPSLYEGFGMTILEAFSMKCPVVASNISSIPEVAGDAAYYIDPENTKSIKDGVEKVIGDPLLRNKLVNRGLKQVKKFTWEKTVRETLKVYEKAIINK